MEHEVAGLIVSPVAEPTAAPPQMDDTWSAALEHLGGEILTYNVLYNIFLRSPDALFIVDNRQIVAVNNAASLYFAYHISELLAGTIDMLFPEDLHDILVAEWDEFINAPRFRAMNGGRPMDWRKKTGEAITAIVELTPLVEVAGLRVIVRVRHCA